MDIEKPIYEIDNNANELDPDEIPIRDRKLITQPYDLTVKGLIDQINDKTIFLNPISERPTFQRRYVWTDILASKLIESILLKVPIPPCYFSQNEQFELDVIDGQQRLFSVYRFVNNQFELKGLEVLDELNGKKYFEIDIRLQRMLNTQTLRCLVITNESHPEIKFDVFERLNTNTTPLNAQELRNCMFRGALNDLLKTAVYNDKWLNILGRKSPDKRMRDEELVLRFFAFNVSGIKHYRTPLKHWLNEVAKEGKFYSEIRINELNILWDMTLQNALIWFEPKKCFRREGSKAINRALFDLVASSASYITSEKANSTRKHFLEAYFNILHNEEFLDLISRSVDHTKRTKRRFEIWDQYFKGII